MRMVSNNPENVLTLLAKNKMCLNPISVFVRLYPLQAPTFTFDIVERRCACLVCFDAVARELSPKDTALQVVSRQGGAPSIMETLITIWGRESASFPYLPLSSPTLMRPATV